MKSVLWSQWPVVLPHRFPVFITLNYKVGIGAWQKWHFKAISTLTCFFYVCRRLSVKGTRKVKLSLSSDTWDFRYSSTHLTTAQDAVFNFNKQPLVTRRSLSIGMPFATPEPPGNIWRFDEPQHLPGCGEDTTTLVYNYLLLIYSVLHVFLAFFKTRRFPTKGHLYS